MVEKASDRICNDMVKKVAVQTRFKYKLNDLFPNVKSKKELDFPLELGENFTKIERHLFEELLKHYYKINLWKDCLEPFITEIRQQPFYCKMCKLEKENYRIKILLASVTTNLDKDILLSLNNYLY